MITKKVAPVLIDSFGKAQKLLRLGKPIIISDADREGEADLALAAEHCNPKSVNTLLTYGKGLVCVALGYKRANQIGVERLMSNCKDIYSTPFGMPLGVITATTGISAEDRAKTINCIANDNATINEFIYPGHVHTLIEHPDGLMKRRGHTEAVVYLMRTLGFKDCGVLCEILNEEGQVATETEIDKVAKELNSVIISINEIVDLFQAEGVLVD